MDPLKLRPTRLATMVSQLTARQKQVVVMLARGMSDKEASQLLSISIWGYRRHIHNACERLKLENRIQLIVLYALVKGIEKTKAV